MHVCRKWRSVACGSPYRLDLRLYCSERTPMKTVKRMLDVWPLLPIVISTDLPEMDSVDNVIAALEHNDRVCKLDLFNFQSWHFEKVLEAMQQPFPALIYLHLHRSFPIHSWVDLPKVCNHSGLSVSISGTTQATSVRHSPCSSYSSGISLLGMHLTRHDGLLPLCAGQADRKSVV